MSPHAVGLLLAAGEGRRMGMPKALVHARDGSSWLRESRRRLLAAGCADVLTVLGAQAPKAQELLGDGWNVIAEDWNEGMSASMRAGLLELLEHTYEVALIHLVDLPDVGVDIIQRILAHAAEDSLHRAVYQGVPGHPVLIGRAHWLPLIEELDGDTGAKHYLRAHGAEAIECSDLATGKDVDTAEGV